MTDPQGYCPIQSTLVRLQESGALNAALSTRETARHLGKQMHTLCEQLFIVLGQRHSQVHRMSMLADELCRGDHDEEVAHAMRTDATNMLRCGLAAIEEAIAVAGAQGADVAAAYRAFGRGERDASKLREYTVNAR